MAAFIRLVKIIWQHRSLIVELVKREVKLRYRGTWLGFLWSLLNPLIMTVVYTVVFVYFFNVSTPNYSVFLFCALLPWTWFNEAVMSGTDCFVGRSGFVRDAIFPTAILPITSIASSMMNYVFSLPILLIALLAFRVPFGWSLLTLPLIMAVQFLFTLGIVFILGTFNVFFRDLRYIVQNLLMALFFLTPIMYDINTIPARFLILLKLNPMEHIINDYRSIFYYNTWPDWGDTGIVAAICLVLIVLGVWAFETHRENFAEYL
jgi:ABC-type polysaccharide/polyol phosphate export permease